MPPPPPPNKHTKTNESDCSPEMQGVPTRLKIQTLLWKDWNESKMVFAITLVDESYMNIDFETIV